MSKECIYTSKEITDDPALLKNGVLVEVEGHVYEAEEDKNGHGCSECALWREGSEELPCYNTRCVKPYTDTNFIYRLRPDLE